MQKSILFITTSHASLGNTDRPTGIWAEELIIPYYLFVDAGISVELASPAGGAAPFDPGSIKPRSQNGVVTERFLADEIAKKKVSAMIATSNINNVQQYDAVFFPGGHGAMWDLPEDKHVAMIVERAFANGKIIASVCHGAAGLASAKSADGKSILAGKRVNAFTNAEETAVGLSEVVPFSLESRIRSLGGLFEHAENWAEFAVQDGQLITGQNPQSSARVAQLILNSFAMKPSSKVA